MKTFHLLAALVGATVFCFSSSTAEEAGEDSSDGLPEAYAKDYLIAGSTASSDKKLAIIYPRKDDEEFPAGKNYIISLKPFAILGTLETKWPYFQHESHGGLSAEWSEDNSVALVTLDGKWGPRDIFVLEFHAGKLTRATNLLAKVHDLLVPDYRKAKAVPYNDVFDFVFDNDDSSWKLEGTKEVRINALGSTDPKGAETGRVWKGKIAATWDIAQAKFTSQKVTRMFAGVRKAGD